MSGVLREIGRISTRLAHSARAPTGSPLVIFSGSWPLADSASSTVGRCPTDQTTSFILEEWDDADSFFHLVERASSGSTTPDDAAKCRALATWLDHVGPPSVLDLARTLVNDLVFGTWASRIVLGIRRRSAASASRAGELLLLHQQLLASGVPLLRRHDRRHVHLGLSSFRYSWPSRCIAGDLLLVIAHVQLDRFDAALPVQ